TAGAQIRAQVGPSVMRDVLVRVATRRQAAIEPLERPPAPPVVVWRAEDQPSARFEHPLQLGKNPLIGRDVLDHFRADHAIECAVLEGKLEDRTMDEWISVAPRIAQLREHDVEADHSGRADDSTRPAADVEHATRAGCHGRDHLGGSSLPVALRGGAAAGGWGAYTR